MIWRAEEAEGVKALVTGATGFVGSSVMRALLKSGHQVGPLVRAKSDLRDLSGLEVARDFAAGGLPLVVVNPSTPVGMGDIKPTPTGRTIVDFLNGRMPAYLDTGLNIVDVEDVAEGHLLAAEKGRIGERYILGHENLTLKEILDILADLTGLPAPRLRLPYYPVLVLSCVYAAAHHFLGGRQPQMTPATVRLARKRMFFDPSKAVQELGWRQNPARESLGKAVLWFREHGYVRR
jgi:dihydroflavonol-4-reductase